MSLQSRDGNQCRNSGGAAFNDGHQFMAGIGNMAERSPSLKDLQVVTSVEIDQLALQAAAAPRKRAHLLLHSGPDDQVQRLLIAAEPGTYVRPHQHSQQWEMLTVQRGQLDVLIFAANGIIRIRSKLDRTAPVIQIPPAHWHTCVVREPGTLILEIKPGPFRANEFAAWAPDESDERAAGFLDWAASGQREQRWPSA